MLSEDLVRLLTHRVTVPGTGRSHVVVWPGLALALSDADPLHVIGDALARLVDACLGLVPAGAISALCGAEEREPFSRRGLDRRQRKVRGKGCGTRTSTSAPGRSSRAKGRTGGP